MKYEIDDVNGNLLHMAEFDGSEEDSVWRKKRMAVMWAVKNGKSLARANLQGFDMTFLDLRRKDFTWANIKNACFMDSDLRGAKFSHDAPVVEKIHQTVFEVVMNMTEQETLDWPNLVVRLAGNEGYKLKKEIGTATAAALIYMASDPILERIPFFHNLNEEEMLSYMKRLAEREKHNET